MEKINQKGGKEAYFLKIVLIIVLKTYLPMI
jgi:hypothetical protein